MAVNAIPILIVLGGSPTNPGQATSFQGVAPWGQTQAYTVWEEVVEALFKRNSRFSGGG